MRLFVSLGGVFGGQRLLVDKKHNPNNVLE
jgi:hypothetical protein